MRKKHIFILLMTLTSLFLASCDKGEEINTGKATVSMGKATISVKESKGLFNVPVIVTGEQNGDIKVKVDVKCDDPNCIKDKHFLVTSTEVTIPASKQSVNIEIKSVDDRVINEDRTFSIYIVYAEGATVSEQDKSTLITLLDNDDIPYDRMDGEWTVTARDMLAEDGPKEVTWKTKLSTIVEEDEEGYGSLITMSPWRMWNGETYEGSIDIKQTLSFSYNPSSQTATLTLKLGETMCEGIILGDKDEEGHDLTDCFMRSATPTQTSYTINGSIIGSVNGEFNKITFNLPLMGVLYDTNGQPFSYWFWYENIILTRQ